MRINSVCSISGLIAASIKISSLQLEINLEVVHRYARQHGLRGDRVLLNQTYVYMLVSFLK